MEKFNKNIEGIRKMLMDKKSEKYAISNPDLLPLEEYIKNLYLKVLCTVVQYENDPTEKQILLLKRLVSGMEVEAPVEEYMRKALEISATDMQEFLSYMRDNKNKYYFLLEGILLVALGKPEQANYEYLSEIIELINVNKDDLIYMSLVAKSVLQQESSFYDEAKKVINERVKNIDFTPYIKSYYAGAIVDSDTEKHYSAPDKKYSKSVVYPSKYKERKVVFENLSININDEWIFDGCEEVVFKNCILEGGKQLLNFSSVGTVKIENCEVKNFTNRVAKLYSVNNFIVTDSVFLECGFTCSGDCSGGIFSSVESVFHTIRIENNKFLNCYIAASTYRSNYGVTGILIGTQGGFGSAGSFVLIGNEFIGCACRNNGNYTEAIIGRFYFEEVMEQKNKCIGGVTRIFESE